MEQDQWARGRVPAVAEDSAKEVKVGLMLQARGEIVHARTVAIKYRTPPDNPVISRYAQTAVM